MQDIVKTKTKTKQTFNKLIENISSFLYPRICLICREKIILNENYYTVGSNPRIESTEFCCYKCKSKLQYAPDKEDILNLLLVSFPDDKLAISNAVSLFQNSKEIPVINLAYKLKYGGFTRIGTEYGTWLGELLVEQKLTQYDYIVPVPIHKARKRERGYNQTYFIADGVGQIIKVPVVYDILKKIKYTVSQTTLTTENRKTNLLDVFQMNKVYDVAGKRILLVDDILTTGSTVNTCATTLLENGASIVDVATLIKA